MLPLHALLSQVLVALTIGFDNEFEHRMPHSTTNHGKTPGVVYAPWLISLAMWANCLRFIDDEGISVNELENRARTKINLNGMQRWGYIRIGADRLIRLSVPGRKAQEICRPLDRVIETQWEERFGQNLIRNLREQLSALVADLDPTMPDYLPTLTYGLYSQRPVKTNEIPSRDREGTVTQSRGAELPLYAMFSRPLLTFAEEFEARSEISLMISANVLRVFDTEAVLLRDLPLRSGISKELIKVATGFLVKKDLMKLETVNRSKIACLTEHGIEARKEYFRLVDEIGKDWRSRFGEKTIAELCTTLERLTGDGTSASLLFRAIEPYPDGWRASVPRPATLPHFPAVTHRGGYPDGA